MSEALISQPSPEALAPYVADVQKRADEWLSIHPTAKRRTEIREPEKAALALYLLDTTSMGQMKVAAAVGLSNREIGTLLFHRPELWEKRRPRLAMDLAATTEELLDVMGEKIARIKESQVELDSTPLKDIALSVGILSDKAATFNGMATAVVEHRSGPSIADARQAIEEARAKAASLMKAASLEAEVISHDSVEGTSDTQAAE